MSWIHILEWDVCCHCNNEYSNKMKKKNTCMNIRFSVYAIFSKKVKSVLDTVLSIHNKPNLPWGNDITLLTNKNKFYDSIITIGNMIISNLEVFSELLADS